MEAADRAKQARGKLKSSELAGCKDFVLNVMHMACFVSALPPSRACANLAVIALDAVKLNEPYDELAGPESYAKARRIMAEAGCPADTPPRVLNALARLEFNLDTPSSVHAAAIAAAHLWEWHNPSASDPNRVSDVTQCNTRQLVRAMLSADNEHAATIVRFSQVRRDRRTLCPPTALTRHVQRFPSADWLSIMWAIIFRGNRALGSGVTNADVRHMWDAAGEQAKALGCSIVQPGHPEFNVGPLPDEVHDKHTAGGKRKGRGVKHFYEQGCKLVGELVPDPYRAGALSIYLRREKQSPKLVRTAKWRAHVRAQVPLAPGAVEKKFKGTKRAAKAKQSTGKKEPKAKRARASNSNSNGGKQEVDYIDVDAPSFSALFADPVRSQKATLATNQPAFHATWLGPARPGFARGDRVFVKGPFGVRAFVGWCLTYATTNTTRAGSRTDHRASRALLRQAQGPAGRDQRRQPEARAAPVVDVPRRGGTGQGDAHVRRWLQAAPRPLVRVPGVHRRQRRRRHHAGQGRRLPPPAGHVPERSERGAHQSQASERRRVGTEPAGGAGLPLRAGTQGHQQAQHPQGQGRGASHGRRFAERWLTHFVQSIYSVDESNAGNVRKYLLRTKPSAKWRDALTTAVRNHYEATVVPRMKQWLARLDDPKIVTLFNGAPFVLRDDVKSKLGKLLAPNGRQRILKLCGATPKDLETYGTPMAPEKDETARLLDEVRNEHRALVAQLRERGLLGFGAEPIVESPVPVDVAPAAPKGISLQPCPVCFEEYDDGAHRVMSTQCGHLLCQHCCGTMAARNHDGWACPMCQSTNTDVRALYL